MVQPSSNRLLVESQRGAPNGLASLGADSLVPDAQLPARLGAAALVAAMGSSKRRFNVADYGAAGDGVTIDRAAVQAAMDAASPVRGIVELNGTHKLDNQLLVPSNITIDGSRGKLVMSVANKTTLQVLNAVNVTIKNVESIGYTADYVNNSTVYNATGIYISGTSDNIKVVNNRLIGHAGAGVYVSTTPRNVLIKHNTIEGPGPTYITSTAFNYGAGVVSLASEWTTQDNEISEYAQGIVTGDNMADVKVIGNYIHDIRGQHGFYLDSLSSGVVSNNIVERTALTGMKVQITDAATMDARGVTITGNVFNTCGAQGILLTNVAVTKTFKIKDVVVSGNVVIAAASSGIEANNMNGLIITDNMVTDCLVGAKLNDGTNAVFSSNIITRSQRQAIVISKLTDYALRYNRIVDPCTLNEPTSEFAIYISDALTANGILDGNKITDSLGNMLNGIYFVSGDATTHSFIGNYVSGTTGYGIRFTTASAVRAWRENDVSATAGVTGTPTSASSGSLGSGFAAAAPTTGFHLRGEQVSNSVPAVGSPKGWICTVSGTPGTWVSTGNL